MAPDLLSGILLSRRWLGRPNDPVLKRHALDNTQHQRGERVIPWAAFAGDRAHGRCVVILDVAPDAVHQQLLVNRLDELVRIVPESVCRTPSTPSILRAVGQSARHVDGLAGVVVPPSSHGVEIFQRESDRIHARVAAGAGRIGAMPKHRFAHGERLAGCRSCGIQRRNIRRRRRRRRGQQILQNILAPQHRLRCASNRTSAAGCCPAPTVRRADCPPET